MNPAPPVTKTFIEHTIKKVGLADLGRIVSELSFQNCATRSVIPFNLEVVL